MLFNYLKLSLRLMVRNPFFTTINIVGLAIGFTAFYALWEYSTLELNSDHYHKAADRIGRIGINWSWSEDGGKTWGSHIFGFARAKLLPAIKEDFPEIESTLQILPQPVFNEERVGHGDKVTLSVIDANNLEKSFKEEHVVYADSNLFTFFSIPLIYGHAITALNKSNNVALSQSVAEKYFGKRDPVGELIMLNDSITLQVSAVFADLPHYSHLDFDVAISNLGHLNKWQSLFWVAPTCYVRLNSTNLKEFEDKLRKGQEKYFGDFARTMPHVRMSTFVQPLKEIPFSEPPYIGDTFTAKSRSFLRLLAFIGISVIIMAWVNYVNITISRLARRMKEIATRKVSGAKPGDMFGQFMMEALIINLLALILAFTFLQLIRIPAAVWFDIKINTIASLNLISFSILFAIILAGILFSGLYPALISINFQPRSIFRMAEVKSNKRFIPSVLTIGQIAAAIIFMVVGFGISMQLNYILNKDTGINRDAAIVLEGPVSKPLNYMSSLSSFKQELAGNSKIEAVATSKFDVNHWEGGTVNTRRVGTELTFGFDNNCIDEDFIPFYGLKLIAGRNFRKDDLPEAIILSRRAISRLGFINPEDAVGSKINLRILYGEWMDAVIVGVVENFRNTSYLNMAGTEFDDNGRGLIFLNDNQKFSDYHKNPDLISFRLSDENVQSTITQVQRMFEKYFPGSVFTWSFLEEKLNVVYRQEMIARNQVILFTMLAIIIACLGVLGMITNLVAERVKEIGIRKVLGAKWYHISRVLLGATGWQIMIATAIGIPLAYFIMKQYLEKYSERIVLQWWHFALPIAILFSIMLLTIASVLLKAARTNPIEALKYE